MIGPRTAIQVVGAQAPNEEILAAAADELGRGENTGTVDGIIPLTRDADYLVDVVVDLRCRVALTVDILGKAIDIKLDAEGFVSGNAA